MSDYPMFEEIDRCRVERDRAVDALKPFAGLGGGPEIQAYADLEDDIVVYKNSGSCITVGDIRNARRVLAGILGEPVSETHFRRAPSVLEQENIDLVALTKKTRPSR